MKIKKPVKELKDGKEEKLRKENARLKVKVKDLQKKLNKLIHKQEDLIQENAEIKKQDNKPKCSVCNSALHIVRLGPKTLVSCLSCNTRELK